MKKVSIVLMGYGNVGRAFLCLVKDKSEILQERYGLSLCFSAIVELGGTLCFPRTFDPESIVQDWPDIAFLKTSPYWKPGYDVFGALDELDGEVLVDCTPSRILKGTSEISSLHLALERGWNVVTANKGPLVADFRGLIKKAKQKKVELKMSGATAAALPTIDVGCYSLAGTSVTRIEGILNGTTNYILTRISKGVHYDEAVKEAQEKGITEPDPSLDLEGWDTAFKILLITNNVCDTDFSLDDVRIEGIKNMPSGLIEEGREEDKALKLMGIYSAGGNEPDIQVKPSIINRAHPLFGVDDTNKGITFHTDTMSAVTVTGGKSDPRGAAAALLKDIINIYR